MKRGEKAKVHGRTVIRICFLLLFPAALALRHFAALCPRAVEHIYTRGFYRGFRDAVSVYFNLFPFSCAELILYSGAVFIVFAAVLAVVRLFRRQTRAFLRMAVAAGCVFASFYFLFTLMWGLNYYRPPIEQSLGYRAGVPSVGELAAMLKDETAAINGLCGCADYDKGGRSHYSGGFKTVSAEVEDGYGALASQNATDDALFGSGRPRPKGIFASGLLSYTGIEGIFVPFTYEPNVDTDTPDFVQPFDAAHESAHFKGFAREDEANFCAYLADSESPDPYFRYSAHMEAYIYISNALYETDEAAWKKAAVGLDRRAAGDIACYGDYVAAHKSKVRDVSDKVNDDYLKSQGQKGIVTYDMFVTLLADKYRTEGR